MSSAAIRAPVVKELRFTEHDDWFGAEDLELWLRLVERGHFLFIPQTVTGIRTAAGITRSGLRLQHLRALNVVVTRYKLGLDERDFRLTLGRRIFDAAIQPGGNDEAADVLKRTFDGHAFGRVRDRLVVGLIRAGWRSSVLAPILRRLRAAEYRTRVRLQSSPVLAYADGPPAP
jgi:hypothetical protein